VTAAQAGGPAENGEEPRSRQRILVAAAAVALLAAVAVLLVLHPWSGGSSPDRSAAGSPPSPPATSTDPPAEPSVVCDRLSDAAPLRAMESALPALAAGQGSPEDRAAAVQAVATLRSWAQQLQPGTALAERLEEVASAVDSMAAGQAPTEAQLTTLTTAFTGLDGEVQQACALPLD
jgi:hypothetical protein